MNKGERISRLVAKLGESASGVSAEDVAAGVPQEDVAAGVSAEDVAAGVSPAITSHPCFVGFFRCWNEQRYYEAHDVLEHLWLRTKDEDATFFKGLIQAAGAFVHLQKQYVHPTHPKHGRRLYPAVRLFRLAEKNLRAFEPARHGLDVTAFLTMTHGYAQKIVDSHHEKNPWSPDHAPHVHL